MGDRKVLPEVSMAADQADGPAENGTFSDVRLDMDPRASSMTSAVEGMDFEDEQHAETPTLSTRGMTVAFRVGSAHAMQCSHQATAGQLLLRETTLLAPVPASRAGMPRCMLWHATQLSCALRTGPRVHCLQQRKVAGEDQPAL